MYVIFSFMVIYDIYHALMQLTMFYEMIMDAYRWLWMMIYTYPCFSTFFDAFIWYGWMYDLYIYATNDDIWCMWWLMIYDVFSFYDGHDIYYWFCGCKKHVVLMILWCRMELLDGFPSFFSKIFGTVVERKIEKLWKTQGIWKSYWRRWIQLILLWFQKEKIFVKSFSKFWPISFAIPFYKII